MRESVVKMPERDWAELLDMTEGALNTILNWNPARNKRKRNLDADLIDVIQRKACNRAISQFFDMQSRGLLNHQSSLAKLRRLEAEVEAERERLKEVCA